MTTLAHVEAQLKRVGYRPGWTGKAEVRELTRILMPGEVVAGCVNGRYENGFAMLCVTNHRLLLIDRKPLFLKLQDIRFDMISQVDFRAQLLSSSMFITTPSHQLSFHSWNQHRLRLRDMLTYTQQRIMEIRQRSNGLGRQLAATIHTYAAPLMGGLGMQGAADGQMTSALPLNPYTRVPVLMRRRLYPKFY